MSGILKYFLQGLVAKTQTLRNNHKLHQTLIHSQNQQKHHQTLCKVQVHRYCNFVLFVTHHSSTLQVAELADYDSECNPSVAPPVGSHTREVCILQGQHQSQFSKFNITIQNGKASSFCSKWYDMHEWLEYSPKVDRMYCFNMSYFAIKVPGSVG